jgi:hypothetical protein
MPVDFIVGAAIGAAAASTKVRKAVRQGMIYGVGGVLVAYDKLAASAHAVAQSARQAATAATAAKGATSSPANGSPTADTGSSAPPAAPSPAASAPT